jgi:8-oxo-dGTP diphosphatase
MRESLRFLQFDGRPYTCVCSMPETRIEVVLGIVVRHGRVLIGRRRKDDHLAGYWEFPGGKRQPGETLDQCLERELAEELSIRVKPVHAFEPIDHDYPTVSVRLYPYLCRHESGEAEPLACDELQWVDPSELRDYRFPPANDELLRELVVRLSDPLLISTPPPPTLRSSGD